MRVRWTASGSTIYAYVGNDPLGSVDPSGLCIGPLAIVCVAIADYGVEAAAVTEAAVLIGTDTPAPGASVGNLGTEIKAAQSVANECKPSAYSTIYEMTLQQSSYPGVSRARHFQEANESLLQAMERDPQFAQMINDAGVDLARTPTGLAPRTSPNGWTWHHEVDDGLMRLVPRSQHSSGSQYWDVLHPSGVGGYSIWGK